MTLQLHMAIKQGIEEGYCRGAIAICQCHDLGTRSVGAHQMDPSPGKMRSDENMRHHLREKARSKGYSFLREGSTKALSLSLTFVSL